MRESSATPSPTLTYRKIEAGHYAVMRDGQCVARLLCWSNEGRFPVWHAYLNPKPCPFPIALCGSLRDLKRHIGPLLAAQADAPEGHQAELLGSLTGAITLMDRRAWWYAVPQRYDVDNPPPTAPRWVERMPAPIAEVA